MVLSWYFTRCWNNFDSYWTTTKKLKLIFDRLANKIGLSIFAGRTINKYILMKIKVLFFGITKDITNKSNLELEFDENKDVNYLVGLLEEKFPKFSSVNGFSVAVNEEYVKRDIVLKNNDIVAIIPPVSGG